MNRVNLLNESIHKFLNKEEINEEILKANQMLNLLKNETHFGNEWLGWKNIDRILKSDELKEIILLAEEIKNNCEVLVVVGIGGSYLGAKAALDFLGSYFKSEGIEVIFAGHQISSAYISELIDYIGEKDIYVNVISKSGKTTEPAVAFRFIKDLMTKKYKDNYNKRIIATTSENTGALVELSKQEGFRTLIVPENIGGRYSVFTPVGLLPIASKGYNIEMFLKGAQEASLDLKIKNNIATKYAAIRNLLYKKGYEIEMLINYEQKLNSLSEWWKQLFGESEGKDGKGIFVSSATFSTDLHSLGQYIQDGPKKIFETTIEIQQDNSKIEIQEDTKNLDELNYLSGKTLDYVNKTARKATTIAHIEGGVPNILLTIENDDECNLGYLMYFFMISCSISGYMIDVNPFDQPGVEDYKTSMFKLLGKPGF